MKTYWDCLGKTAIKCIGKCPKKVRTLLHKKFKINGFFIDSNNLTYLTRPENFNGIYVKLYDNGQLSYEWNYKNGKFHGKQCYWYENGNKKSEIDYNYEFPCGFWTWWYENGKIIKQIKWTEQTIKLLKKNMTINPLNGKIIK